MNLLQSEVEQFSKKVYGEQSEEALMAALDREVLELRNVLVYPMHHTNKDFDYECADVLICLMALCSRRGISLETALREKMFLNYKRFEKRFI